MPEIRLLKQSRNWGRFSYDMAVTLFIAIHVRGETMARAVCILSDRQPRGQRFNFVHTIGRINVVINLN